MVAMVSVYVRMVSLHYLLIYYLDYFFSRILIRVRAQFYFVRVQTELKNANGYVSALRHRTWAQARPHLK